MERIEKPLITVVGATSKQGRSVVNSLMQSRRFRVRALTRRKDSPQAIQLQKVGAELWEVIPIGIRMRWCRRSRDRQARS